MTQLVKDSQNEFLIETIFPAEEVHLIGGPSGAGKSSWLIGFIRDWQKGDSLFGYKSYPQPFVYVSCDRSKPGILRTFKRLKIDPETFPYMPMVERDDLLNIPALVDNWLKDHPETKVFFIEGLATFAPSGRDASDYGKTAGFIKRLTRLCQAKHITIVGIVHSPKMREKDRYLNPRQRVLGSVSWAAYAETIILVEPACENDPTSGLRHLTLLPRNAPEEVFDLNFTDSGELILAKDDTCHKAMFVWLGRAPVETVFKTEDAYKEGRSHGFTDRSVKRWLRHALDQGIIHRVAHGEYRKPTPC